jgi:hypothetical protein
MSGREFDHKLAGRTLSWHSYRPRSKQRTGIIFHGAASLAGAASGTVAIFMAMMFFRLGVILALNACDILSIYMAMHAAVMAALSIISLRIAHGVFAKMAR